MTVPNFCGVMIIEALKKLGKPVPIAEIINKVASFLECPPKLVEDLVIKAVNGGVHYGFIQQSRGKFACFPINLSGLTDDDNLYGTRKKKKARNSPISNTKIADAEYTRYSSSTIGMSNVKEVGRLNLKRSASTCTYIRSKQDSNGSSENKYTSSNFRKAIRKSEPEPKSKWRI